MLCRPPAALPQLSPRALLMRSFPPTAAGKAFQVDQEKKAKK